MRWLRTQRLVGCASLRAFRFRRPDLPSHPPSGYFLASASAQATCATKAVGSDGKATVAWSKSWTYSSGMTTGYAKDTVVTSSIPAGLIVNNTQLIWSEVTYDYTPTVGLKICRPRSPSAGSLAPGAHCGAAAQCETEVCAPNKLILPTAHVCSTTCCKDADCALLPGGGYCYPASFSPGGVFARASPAKARRGPAASAPPSRASRGRPASPRTAKAHTCAPALSTAKVKARILRIRAIPRQPI